MSPLKGNIHLLGAPAQAESSTRLGPESGRYRIQPQRACWVSWPPTSRRNCGVLLISIQNKDKQRNWKDEETDKMWFIQGQNSGSKVLILAGQVSVYSGSEKESTELNLCATSFWINNIHFTDNLLNFIDTEAAANLLMCWWSWAAAWASSEKLSLVWNSRDVRKLNSFLEST